MESIDALRREVCRNGSDRTVTLVADHIDKIEQEIKECYVELPKDADGEHIHIGDKLMGKYLEGNPIVECTRLTFADDWTVGHCRGAGTPNLFVHLKPPTVEDVLRDFAYCCEEGATEQSIDEIIAEFAAKLQLREAE